MYALSGVRRQNRKEKEFIDVIPSENVNGGGKVKEQKTFAGADDKKEGASAGTVPVHENRADRKENAKGAATMQETEYEQWRAQAVREILDETREAVFLVEKRLPINIEGEPQERKKAEKLQSKCRQRRGRTPNRTAGIRRSERRRYGKYWRNFLLRKCIFVRIKGLWRRVILPDL